MEEKDMNTLKDPPGWIQLVLSIALCVLCGATIKSMWGWYVVPLGVPSIGLAHAMGLDMLITFFVTTKAKPIPEKFLERWIYAIMYALLVLLFGWALHFFI